MRTPISQRFFPAGGVRAFLALVVAAAGLALAPGPAFGEVVDWSEIPGGVRRMGAREVSRWFAEQEPSTGLPGPQAREQWGMLRFQRAERSRETISSDAKIKVILAKTAAATIDSEGDRKLKEEKTLGRSAAGLLAFSSLIGLGFWLLRSKPKAKAQPVDMTSEMDAQPAPARRGGRSEAQALAASAQGALSSPASWTNLGASVSPRDSGSNWRRGFEQAPPLEMAPPPGLAGISSPRHTLGKDTARMGPGGKAAPASVGVAVASMPAAEVAAQAPQIPVAQAPVEQAPAPPRPQPKIEPGPAMRPVAKLEPPRKKHHSVGKMVASIQRTGWETLPTAAPRESIRSFERRFAMALSPPPDGLREPAFGDGAFPPPASESGEMVVSRLKLRLGDSLPVEPPPEDSFMTTLPCPGGTVEPDGEA